jgi:glucose/arabinose dehydrogenase
MPFLLLAIALLLAAPVAAQSTTDPFPTPIPATEGAITVSFREFAVVPDMDGLAPRMMAMVNEPGTRRLFVSDMRGPIYGISYDGKSVRQYVDVNAPTWAVVVQSGGRERGVQSFAFHPQFNQAGTRGFGKFYTFTDTANTKPAPDFKPLGGTRTQDTVLLEWTAKNPAAETYDGGQPRELLRMEQPFANHNGGLIAFNPTAAAGSPDFGLLYVSFADGGSGGDPFNQAQNLNSIFGKLLRIDPLGTNSANGKYGIPASNPFASDKDPNTLGEIYAYGLRNPQRFTWDSKNGNMFLADIGQNIVEEVDLITSGGNYGWNVWEGSFKYLGRDGVDRANSRGDGKVTFPLAEYGQLDPLLQPQSSVTMGTVYRQTAIKQLSNLLMFGDIPSGEIFYVSADNLPKGGQDPIRRVLLNDGGTPKTLLELIKASNAKQGKQPATRADLRFGVGQDGQIFLLNKGDGIVRVLVPDAR